MAEETIYRQEQEIIKNAESLIKDKQYENSDLLDEFSELTEQYKKLFKRFNKIVKINDKQQHELFTVNGELKQLNATKDKFFSIISHDLKSPINGFLNVASLLIDHIDRYSREEIQKMATNVKTSGTNLMKLLENLLHWSRLQMNHVEFTPTYCDLKSLTDGVLSIVSNQAKEKNIALSCNLSQGTNVYVDPNMISSVIQNLVSNAIKFTHPEGCITVDQNMDGDYIEISVIDTGVGITERNLQKLFRIDVIYTGLGTNSEKGTGLGLILCKEMVERHKGKIWVKSEKGDGSVFTFTCPISEVAYSNARDS